ncbi:MAG: HAD-superfamily subfamily hydrolase [Candidatus Saccharibacteria bacterium]|nr:HAD-superfamily subfamily hydrolase [Candidatus Saccharibacteria bacterium]
MAKRPFAAFDIDGTIIRWQLYHAIADELAREGHLDPIQYQKVHEARMAWKTRTGDDSFDSYERTLVNLVNVAITGIEVDAAMQAYSSVITEYKDQVYTYTRDLIRDLKAQNYLLFAISGSQNEIVELLAQHYGFDDFGGTTYEIKDGRFTGKNNPLRSERKPEFLKQLVEKHGADWQGSIAVGDSESDIPMLSIVQQPIAFNPSRSLFEHAQKEQWNIVLERKNMIYKLEPQAGTYVLGQ